MAKEWAWSYSKKKSYDECPKKHYELDIAKTYTDDTDQLRWGNEVHKAVAGAILHAKGLPGVGSGRDRVTPAPLAEAMANYQKWVDVVTASPGEVLVERKYAITRNFTKTDWFADNVWYRGICDLLMITGDTATALDWKTGKVRHDSIQLMLMATCIFIHHPQVNKIKTRFIWLAHDCSTPDTFERATIMNHWLPLLPQLQAWQDAAAKMDYPPKPNRLCRKWCPVVSCPYHGK